MRLARVFASLPVLFFLLGPPENARADDQDLVGGRVVLRNPKKELKIEDKVVGRGDIFRVYRVDRQSGDWVWLVHTDLSGWAQKNDVLPLEQAIDQTTNLIQKDPKSTWSYLYRGGCWLARGELDLAIADYDDVIRLKPENASAFANRGIAWERKGDLQKAISDYSEAIRLDPKYASYHVNRGNALRMLARYEDALKEYDAAIEADKNFAPAHANRAWIRATCADAKFRDGKKAVESAARACALTQERAASQLDILAAAHAEVGNFDEAVKQEKTAIANLPQSDSDSLARYQTHLKHYEEKKPWREVPPDPNKT